MIADDKKICPLCAEEIKSAAKVCPYCRRWQERWSLQNPQIIAALWTLLYVMFFCGVAVFFERLFKSRNDFFAYRSQVVVLNSEVSVFQSGTNRYVGVIGIITNQSPISWSDVNVEARFFDTDGKLVDVVPGKGAFSGFPISAHAEAAFKIQSKQIESTNDFVSHKVSVTWAKNANAWP